MQNDNAKVKNAGVVRLLNLPYRIVSAILHFDI